MSEWTVDTLHELFDRVFVEHKAFHDLERTTNQRALEEYRDEILRRLAELNQLRAEVIEDRGMLVQRTAFELKVASIEKDVRQLNGDVGQIREVMSKQSGRAAAYAVVLAVALVVIPFLIQLVLR